MKKIFLVCAAVTVLAACDSDSKPGMETKKEIVPDSSAYKNTVNTDTAKVAPVPLAPLPAKTEVSKGVSTAKKTKATPTPVTTPPSPVSSTDSSTPTNDTTSGTSTTAAPKKKGMSNSAKGAIIGAGAGAVSGAIISKKKGKGAVIGGIIGAGAGYIIGKKKDKKDTAR